MDSQDVDGKTIDPYIIEINILVRDPRCMHLDILHAESLFVISLVEFRVVVWGRQVANKKRK